MLSAQRVCVCVQRRRSEMWRTKTKIHVNRREEKKYAYNNKNEQKLERRQQRRRRRTEKEWEKEKGKVEKKKEEKRKHSSTQRLQPNERTNLYTPNTLKWQHGKKSKREKLKLKCKINFMYRVYMCFFLFVHRFCLCCLPFLGDWLVNLRMHLICLFVPYFLLLC